MPNTSTLRHDTGTILYTYRYYPDGGTFGTGGATAAVWSPDGKRIASIAQKQDTTVQVWNALDGSQVLTYRGHAGRLSDPSNQFVGKYVRAVAWSPDGKYIASGGNDETVQVWDAITGQRISIYAGYSSGTTKGVAWSPDGKHIVSIDSPEKNGPPPHMQPIRVWNALNGSLVYTYRDHSTVAWSLAWAPRPHIAVGLFDGTMKVWDAVNGRSLYTCRGHVTGIRSVAWSPDGQYIASASGGFIGDASKNNREHIVCVWKAHTGERIYTYHGHSDFVQTVAWSPESRRIVSGDSSGTIQIWNALDGNHIYTYTGHQSLIDEVAWSPDGTKIVSASWDQTVQVWQAP